MGVSVINHNHSAPSQLTNYHNYKHSLSLTYVSDVLLEMASYIKSVCQGNHSMARSMYSSKWNHISQEKGKIDSLICQLCCCKETM